VLLDELPLPEAVAAAFDALAALLEEDELPHPAIASIARPSNDTPANVLWRRPLLSSDKRRLRPLTNILVSPRSAL
jgi:hypothetical protein